MKRTIFAVMMLLCGMGVYAATNEVVFFEEVEEEDLLFSEDEFQVIESAEIGGVRLDDWKNDDKEKYEVVKVETYQPGEEDEQIAGFRIHIVAEIIDKEKNTYLVDYTAAQPFDFEYGFTGQCFWELRMKHGDLNRPKVNAYAIHFGILEDEDGYPDEEDRFVVLSEEYDDVDTMDELLKRTTTPFEGQTMLKYYYMYDDEYEGETETVPKTLKSL